MTPLIALFLIATSSPTYVPPTIPEVPFYSQFADITSQKWQKVGCGVASLAMIIDYYKPAVAVDTLLKQGIASGAYLQSAGWTYKGLIGISTKYGLDGDSYDLGKLSTKKAFAQFKKELEDGPVIASVHYKFDPKSTIPHLVVIDSIDGDVVYYNDPAAKVGQKQISTTDFLKAWKKRFIVIRPTSDIKLRTQEAAMSVGVAPEKYKRASGS
ncbi:MAG: cysteine peptidase family C39 domain-containing protein [Patescibacteria group bacterium]